MGDGLIIIYSVQDLEQEWINGINSRRNLNVGCLLLKVDQDNKSSRLVGYYRLEPALIYN